MEVKVNVEMKDFLPKSIALGTAMMLSQREKGVEKYGQPIEEADLGASQLVEHAMQEAADGLVYTAMLAGKIAELEKQLGETQRAAIQLQEHMISIRSAAEACGLHSSTGLGRMIFMGSDMAEAGMSSKYRAALKLIADITGNLTDTTAHQLRRIAMRALQ